MFVRWKRTADGMGVSRLMVRGARDGIQGVLQTARGGGGGGGVKKKEKRRRRRQCARKQKTEKKKGKLVRERRSR